MNALKIFVVDDDRDAAEGLAEVLELDGHQVRVAHSGADAVRIFGEQDFDIAFMDVMMPGLNGVESFLKIRKIKPNARVVMMTGYSVEQLLTKAVDGGAYGVLHKPLVIEDVLRKLEDVKPAGMILVADDDPDFCEGIKEILEQHDYQVCFAHTGQQAIDMVLEGDIDVLMLDLRLPVIDGLEVYLQLKNRGCNVPTIVATGYAREESGALEKLREMEGTGVLVKPFDPSDLLAALAEIPGRLA